MANKKNLNKQLQPNKNDSDDYKSFKVALFYCLLIIIFPIVTFFSLKTILFDYYLNLEPIRSNIWAAIFAVISLHIALGFYIYRAYFEKDLPTPHIIGAKKLE